MVQCLDPSRQLAFIQGMLVYVSPPFGPDIGACDGSIGWLQVGVKWFFTDPIFLNSLKAAAGGWGAWPLPRGVTARLAPYLDCRDERSCRHCRTNGLSGVVARTIIAPSRSGTDGQPKGRGLSTEVENDLGLVCRPVAGRRQGIVVTPEGNRTWRGKRGR